MFVQKLKSTQPKYLNTELCELLNVLIEELEIKPIYKLTLNDTNAQRLFKNYKVYNLSI